ncbi:MAG: DUF6647 family protein [Acidiferrobacterales bacterium]
MKELTVAMLMWISGHSPLAYDGSHVPDVISVPQGTLVQIFYQGNVPRGPDINNISVAGVYNPRDGTIYLLDDVDLTTIEGRAVLVHELVHYLQYRHGFDKAVSCVRKLEPTAYAAQAEYLAQHGRAPAFNDIHILLVSTCWRM